MSAWHRSTAVGFGVVLALLLECAGFCAPAPTVKLRGTDFTGGGATTFGSTHAGATRVNYVYAAPTGALSSMAAEFDLAPLPSGPLFLHVRGLLDDGGTPCPLTINLNGVTLFEGPRAFSHQEWEVKRLAISDGVLRPLGNRLEFRNVSSEGRAGMPPWFMLSSCAIGPEDYDLAASPAIEEDFRVLLPEERRPLPEPLSGGRTEPGFRLRGIKGWLWRPEQYLAEIPILARYRMNFLMNCYGSMFDIEHHSFGSPECNRWWEPLPDDKKAAYEQVVRACQEHGIDFCFSLNPNLGSRRAVDYGSDGDFEALWQHYAWMQGLGVRWHNIQFDDISRGIDATGHARLANRLLQRLREADASAEMILCPTYYWGTGEDEAARTYLEALGRELHPDVYVFWTGPSVVPAGITREDARAYREAIGHRLIIWDNYPVNDGSATLHLGPVTGRDADLCTVAEGFMANPMHTQNEIGRIPLLTIADYTYNPFDYDPARAIGQAIAHLADTPQQRETLRDLVELYPGMLMCAQGTGWNPPLQRLEQIVQTPHSRWLADLVVGHLADVLDRLKEQFPGRFTPACATLSANLETMRRVYSASYGEAQVRPAAAGEKRRSM